MGGRAGRASRVRSQHGWSGGRVFGDEGRRASGSLSFSFLDMLFWGGVGTRVTGSQVVLVGHVLGGVFIGRRSSLGVSGGSEMHSGVMPKLGKCALWSANL